ncbi:MAG: hypothetical protein CL419_06305 [Acidimicrobiaceae bacterium]|nr:hypothetical protein [Acidimicrobiaceae bacterium]
MTVSILAAVRSPFAEADGVLAGWHPVDLSSEIADAAITRAGVTAALLDHVWVGCDEPVGAQGANLARAIVLAAGWPVTLGGTVVEAGPHSGVAALNAAVDAIEAGRIERAIVLGVSSASIVQPGAAALARLYGRPWGDGPAARFADDGGLVPPVVAADRHAAALAIDRSAQDAWGQRALERRTPPPAGAILAVGARPGDAVAVQRDTPVTTDVIRSIDHELEPIFDTDGTTTALTFAPAADGVVALVLGRTGEALGEVEMTTSRAGSPLDVVSVRPDRDVDRLDLAAISASTALVALSLDEFDPALVDIDGSTTAVGDAAAAEDLRPLVDGLHRSPAGTPGFGARVSAGAAAGYVWRRL